MKGKHYILSNTDWLSLFHATRPWVLSCHQILHNYEVRELGAPEMWIELSEIRLVDGSMFTTNIGR